jgi:hypothetical protein
VFSMRDTLSTVAWLHYSMPKQGRVSKLSGIEFVSLLHI